MKLFRVFIIPAFLVIVLAGCEKNSPVELTEDGSGSSTEVAVEKTFTVQEPIDPEGQNSTSFFIPAAADVDGQLTIAGSAYDDFQSHKEISTARAILLDKSSPITVRDNMDTLGYRTLDMGTVMIDNIPLQSVVARLADPRLVPFDTIGLRYALLNKDGLGGRGFEYTGTHAYQWSVSGVPGLPPFEAAITSPAAIYVTAPTASDVIPIGRSLTIRWMGGGGAITILICSAGISPHPLLQLKVRRNTGSVTIPRKLLQLLPVSQSRFLFSVTSENKETIRVTGYTGTIAVRAITSHTILFNVRR